MDDIVVVETYRHSIEHVWESLVNPSDLADWLMPGDFKAVVGHKFEFRCEPKGNFDGKVRGEILIVEKPRILAYSWDVGDMKKPTVVTYTLTPLPDGGTKLRLVHSGFSGDQGPFMYSLFKQGWSGKIKELLKNVLEKGAALRGK